MNAITYARQPIGFCNLSGINLKKKEIKNSLNEILLQISNFKKMKIVIV